MKAPAKKQPQAKRSKRQVLDIPNPRIDPEIIVYSCG
jgi:hypothetical protein